MAQASEIQKLREITGAGVMECKRALEDARGDYEKAQKFLADSASAVAKKKAERATNCGLIEGYIHSDIHGSKIGVLVEIACESDFVAKNAQFKDMAHKIAMQIASMNPKDVDELLNQEFIIDPKMKISDIVNNVIMQIKENIVIKRFVRFELGEKN